MSKKLFAKDEYSKEYVKSAKEGVKILMKKYPKLLADMEKINEKQKELFNSIDEHVNSPQWRKQRPLFSGVLAYFPNALMEVAYCSYIGNKQHHPDKPLHWDKSKSTDEADALMRHLKDSGTFDTDGVRHSAKLAWRALALLEREIEKDIHTPKNFT